jgi:hypothetical protein
MVASVPVLAVEVTGAEAVEVVMVVSPIIPALDTGVAVSTGVGSPHAALAGAVVTGWATTTAPQPGQKRAPSGSARPQFGHEEDNL